MDAYETHLASLDVDEAWIVCWAEQGIVEIEALLAKHAAFQAYLNETHGDAAADD
jgi:hypothetical protein